MNSFFKTLAIKFAKNIPTRSPALARCSGSDLSFMVGSPTDWLTVSALL